MTLEVDIVDKQLSHILGAEERKKIWKSAVDILQSKSELRSRTGLALGYVQSGKTTQMIALTAAAYDAGYRIVVALLGSTNLLLEQNERRFLDTLKVNSRNDFRWISVRNPKGRSDRAKVAENLDKGRVVFIPVLKHAKRINNLAELLNELNIEENLKR